MRAHVSQKLPDARTAEPALASGCCGGKLINDSEANLRHRLKHQLRDAVPWPHGEFFLPIVGKNDTNFSVIVGVNNPDSLGDMHVVLQGKT